MTNRCFLINFRWDYRRSVRYTESASNIVAGLITNLAELTSMDWHGNVLRARRVSSKLSRSVVAVRNSCSRVFVSKMRLIVLTLPSSRARNSNRLYCWFGVGMKATAVVDAPEITRRTRRISNRLATIPKPGTYIVSLCPQHSLGAKSMVVRFALFLVFVAASQPIHVRAVDGPAKDIPEMQVLSNYIGTWDVAITSKDSPFTKGESSTSWVLDGRFAAADWRVEIR